MSKFSNAKNPLYGAGFFLMRKCESGLEGAMARGADDVENLGADFVANRV